MTKAQLIAQTLRERIETGELATGTKLSIAILADEFGVAERTARVAVNSLTHTKHIVRAELPTLRATGFYVKQVPPPEILRAINFQ